MALFPKFTSLSDLAKTTGEVRGAYTKLSSPSLTAFTKSANVMSRLYIEDSILRDDICVPLVGTLNQLYVSYILAALNLDTMCANGRTVREQFELVATENYDIIDEILQNFGKTETEYSNEDTVVRLEPDTQRLPVGRVIELTMTGIHVLGTNEEPVRVTDNRSEHHDESSNRRLSGTMSGSGSSTSETSFGTSSKNDRSVSNSVSNGSSNTHTDKDGWSYNNRNGYSNDASYSDQDSTNHTNTHTVSSGKSNTIQAGGKSSSTTQSGWNLQGQKDTGKNSGRRRDQQVVSRDTVTYQFKAYLYVQLIPYVLTPDVVEGYVTANFDPPISKRWTKFRAGEISFWKDFVLARDLIKKQAKVLKQDKHGIIIDMMNHQHNALFRWWEGVVNVVTGHLRSPSHNLANTMLITSKATFDKACRENSINFNNNTQRQRYFNKTWSMIVCVVDPLYNTIEMYFNGVDMKGTYSFAMINKVGAKGQDNFDLKEVMSAFSQGLTPKF